MTSTLRHETCTRDVSTYVTRGPVLRRSDATGENPIYRPAGLAELNRLATGETLVLPVGAPPLDTVWAEAARMRAEEAETQPVVDLAAVMPQPDERPPGYRSRHRTSSRWERDAVMFGLGMLFAAVLLLVGAHMMAAFQ